MLAKFLPSPKSLINDDLMEMEQLTYVSQEINITIKGLKVTLGENWWNPQIFI